MGSPSYRPVSDDWTADEWEQHRAHAAAYLATDPKWVVGPDMVAFYERGRDRARAAEAAACRA